MRKILILTLFFVTLLPLLPWFGSATVHAQGIANENYYICSINGFIQMSLYPCSEGHEIEVIKCKKCGKQYMNYETHECSAADDKIQCPHCGKMLTPEENATHNCLNNGDGDDGNSEGNDGNGNVDGGWLPGVSVPGSRPGYGSGNNSGGNEDIFYGGIGGGGSGGTSDNVTTSSHRTYTSEQELEFAKQLSKVIRSLIEELEKAGRIQYSDKDVNCHYDPKTGNLILPANSDFVPGAVVHELIHYIQDKLEILDIETCSSDNEYQAYVISYIFMTAKGETEHPCPQGVQGTEDWDKLIINIKENCKNINGEITYNQSFLKSLENLDHSQLSEIFRSYWKTMDGENSKEHSVYYETHVDNYNWNWEQILKSLGFKETK